MKKMTLLLATALSVGVLSAIPAYAQESVTVTDTMGREVTVDLPIESCYLGFYYENFLTVVGPDAFTKVTATSLYDTEGFFNTLSTVMRENVPGYADMTDIGSVFQDNFDIEKLIELEPDVVIVGNYQYNRVSEGLEQVEKAGIPVVCVNYSDPTKEMRDTSTKVLGQLFECEDRADEILDTYYSHLQNVEDKVAEIEEKKTTFHEYCSSISSFSELGSSDFSNYCFGGSLKSAGADDLAERLHEEGAEGNGTSLDMEYVLEQDPEVWFVIGGESSDPNKDCVLMGYGVTEDETIASAEGLIDARPGFANLKAVQDDQIYFVDNGAIRTLRDYTLAEFAAKALYPEEFEDLDPQANFDEFGEKYLPGLPNDGNFFYQYHYAE